jgi:hypothetical protein
VSEKKNLKKIKPVVFAYACVVVFCLSLEWFGQAKIKFEIEIKISTEMLLSRWIC